jgi:hypothetical protein
MSTIVLDAIDAELALLEREVPTPSDPTTFGYGTDLSCVSDITDELTEVDPYSPLAVGEAVIRRLTTPRGTLPDDPDYGIDLRSYCNRGVTLRELRDLAGTCRSEILKDDRIEDATVTITSSGTSLAVVVQLALAQPGVQPFTLTFAVTSGAAVLEAIS